MSFAADDPTIDIIIEDLRTYPFFAGLLEKFEPEQILDSLTGVVSRAYIIDFAKELIRTETPFTFAIMDLDNFKFINDTYGHVAGDMVLKDVAASFAEYIRGYGVVGRFGGDELLMINLRDLAYDQKKQFFHEFYDSQRVLRKNILLKDCNPFVTGTVGCATYPDDATDYDGLFELIDKTLYRGKSKGRNCYIIYVESKHKNLVIKDMPKSGVYTSMHGLAMQFEFTPGITNKLNAVLPLLSESLQINDLYYVGRDGRLKAVLDSGLSEDVSDIWELMNDDMYTGNNLDGIRDRCPKLYSVLSAREVEAVMVARVGMDEEMYGYLLCAEPKSHRIWQEDECAVMFFLAKLIAAAIRISGEVL